MNSILLVDDEATISAELQQTLQHFGYHVELAHTVESALQMGSKTHFDVILVDLNLRSERSVHPNGANGTGLVRQLRAAQVNVPILIFTVIEDELHETAALDAGADEYVLKTISIPRLLSRLQANIRRHERDLGKKPTSARWVGVGGFKLDRNSRIFAAGDSAIELTIRETKILEVLLANPGRVVPPKEILDKVWGHDLRKSTTALESVLYRFRQKLVSHEVPDVIDNVKGKGYRLISSRMAHAS